MTTIFLDRDGVINENRDDYVKSWDEFRFLSGAREAIALLTKLEYEIIICTNQAAIAYGYLQVEDLEKIHSLMIREIKRYGGKIEKIYYCTHSKDDNCLCRKPRPGMLLQARDERHVDMRDAIFIGDSISDLQAGIAAGVHVMLVLTGRGQEQLRLYQQKEKVSFPVVRDLRHAVDLILESRAMQDPKIKPMHI